MQKVLITGANGFIGHHLCDYLQPHGFIINAAVRTAHAQHQLKHSVPQEQIKIVGPIDENPPWRELLADVDIVIHTAARAHKMEDSHKSSQKYFSINRDATEKLVIAAIESRVKHFIFLSTLKVNGEVSHYSPFTESQQAKPIDPYSQSKFAAEEIIKEACNSSTTHYTILRLPLVYGDGVKANFAKFMKLATSGLPLPLGNICNQRSLLYVKNLCSAIVSVIHNPLSHNNLYLISDDDDVSTPRLLQSLALAHNKKIRLFPVPLFILKFLATVANNTQALNRLTESLQCDCSKIKQQLHWKPEFTVDLALANMLEIQKK